MILRWRKIKPMSTDSVKKDKNTKLFLHLKKWLEKAVLDYNMIEEGDRVLIGVSGGADSFALLDLLDSPMIFVPRFSFIAVNIDMGFDQSYNAYNALEKYFQENNYRYIMEKTDIGNLAHSDYCLLYTSPSPRDRTRSR